MVLPIALIVIFGILVVAIAFAFPTLYIESVSFSLATKWDDYSGWVYYGEVLTKHDKPHRADDAFRQAIKLRPDRPEAYAGLANLYSKYGQFEAAADAFLRAGENRRLFGTEE